MLLNLVKRDGKGFKLLRLGKPLRWPVNADKARVQIHPGIFTRTASRVIRSSKVTGVLGHEAPVSFEDNWGQLSVLALQQAKIAQMAGLVAAFPCQSGQFNAQALVDEKTGAAQAAGTAGRGTVLDDMMRAPAGRRSASRRRGLPRGRSTLAYSAASFTCSAVRLG